MTYREPPTDDTPRCPRCLSIEAVEPETVGSFPWWCARCLTAFLGSAHEAQHHAAIRLADKAADDDARAAAERALAELREQKP